MERDIKKYILKKDKQHEILAKYYPEEMIDMKSKNMVLCDIFEAQILEFLRIQGEEVKTLRNYRCAFATVRAAKEMGAKEE